MIATNTPRKRRRSNTEEGMESMRGPHTRPRHEFGDTYISGQANVHLGDRLYITSNETAQEQEVRRLQDTLRFLHMHDRHESLRGAADSTYQWIFSELRHDGLYEHHRQVTSFLSWFENGTGLYWISGKPGSGKSTLMKYLAENIISNLTKSTLSRVIVLSYFLWVGGTDLQRNRIGCIRSLLWQALQISSTQSLALRSCEGHFGGLWTQQVLQATLLSFLSSIEAPVIIFLDGLDESCDHDDILSFLDIFDSVPNTKLCVSCRPEVTLVPRLRLAPGLRLEDFNRPDIGQIIKTTFEDDIRVQDLIIRENSSDQQGSLSTLCRQIELKAEGVFLWVISVIKDLLRGITQKDSLSTLFDRLNRLPSDMSMLYQDMLRRTNTDYELYKDQIALYFTLVLHRQFDIIEFHFAIDRKIREAYSSPSIFDLDAIDRLIIDCERVISWIHTRTAGLLNVQVRPSDPNYTNELKVKQNRDTQLFHTMRVFGRSYISFIHRTAYDFVQNTGPGLSLLSMLSVTDADIKQICLESKAIRKLVLPVLLHHPFRPKSSNSVWNHRQSLTCTACTDEDIYALIKARGKNVCATLHLVGSMFPDSTYWDSRSLAGRRGDAFSSSGHVTTDPVPWLIKSRRRKTVLMMLDDNDYMNDNQYLSVLLVHLLQSWTPSDSEKNDFWKLLSILLDNDADLHRDLTTEIGETFSCLAAGIAEFARLHRRDTSFAREISSNMLRSLNLSRTDLCITAKPSCESCHDIWFWGRTVLSPVSSIQIWGSFHAAGIERPGMIGDGFDVSIGSSMPWRSEDDCILVAASVLYQDNPQTVIPQLWAISIADSREILQEGQRKTIGWCPSGVLGIYGTMHEWDGTLSIFKTVFARSSALTFSTAMERLGKSPKTIRKFYEAQAGSMARWKQDGWEQWYWGAQIPATTEVEATDV